MRPSFVEITLPRGLSRFFFLDIFTTFEHRHRPLYIDLVGGVPGVVERLLDLAERLAEDRLDLVAEEPDPHGLVPEDVGLLHLALEARAEHLRSDAGVVIRLNLNLLN